MTTSMPAPKSPQSSPSPEIDRWADLEQQLSQEIGARLRAARGEAGMSQQRLGDLLGYAPNMVSAFETGRRRMKVEDLVRACIALNKEPDYFIRTSPRHPVVGATLRAEVAQLPQETLREFIASLLDDIEAGVDL